MGKEQGEKKCLANKDALIGKYFQTSHLVHEYSADRLYCHVAGSRSFSCAMLGDPWEQGCFYSIFESSKGYGAQPSI